MAQQQSVLVWDWPVRLGHWLMVASFIVAWLTAEEAHLALVHTLAGAVLLGVASFRLLWGFIGTRYARFADFLLGRRLVIEYLTGLMRLAPKHYIGHNPAGGWAIILLLGLAILTSLSGWALLKEIGGESLESVHETFANLMLAAVIVHVAAVVVSSILHREKLLGAMVTGRKAGLAQDGITTLRPLAAFVMLLWVGVVCWGVAFS